MNDAVVWLIIAAFYAPLHFMGPVGVVILTTAVARDRRRLMRYILLECALSMLVAFILVIWLAVDNLKLAMLILFLSMLLPYLLFFMHRLALARKSHQNDEPSLDL